MGCLHLEYTKNIAFIIILVLIDLIITGTASITFQATETDQLDPEFYRSLMNTQSQGIYQAQGPSQTRNTESSVHGTTLIKEQTYQNYYLPERYPLTVNNKILHNLIDYNYKNDTICKLIRITNAYNKYLEKVDVYEIVPKEMNLLNCSIPIRTSSIDEVLRYERHSSLLLSMEDIRDPIGLAKKLAWNETLPFTIREKFSKDELSILNNSSGDNEYSIRAILINKFNNIILNEKLYNLNQSNQNFLKTQTRKLLNLNKANKLSKEDLSLLNFLILRDLFPSHIVKPEGYLEITDDFSLDPITGLIHISLQNMGPKENVIIKYYGNITQQGYLKTTAITRISDNQYPDFLITNDIEFPSPKFNVRVVLSKLQYKPGDDININYIVDLLTPNNISSNYRFPADIANNDSDIYIVNNDSKLLFQFYNGKNSCSKSKTIKINRAGSFSIPMLIIGGNPYLVSGEHITIEEPWRTYIVVLTLLFLGICTIIGGNIGRIQERYIYRYSIWIISLLAIIASGILLEWPLYIGIALGLLIGPPIYWARKDYNNNKICCCINDRIIHPIDAKIHIIDDKIRRELDPIIKKMAIDKLIILLIIFFILLSIILSGVFLNWLFAIGLALGFLISVLIYYWCGKIPLSSKP